MDLAQSRVKRRVNFILDLTNPTSLASQQKAYDDASIRKYEDIVKGLSKEAQDTWAYEYLSRLNESMNYARNNKLAEDDLNKSVNSAIKSFQILVIATLRVELCYNKL